MIQRKCPKCEKGVMSDLYTARGWGKDGFYACDSCEHSKNIYESTTIGPYIIFILFEIVIFALSDRVSVEGYFAYGFIFVFLSYRIVVARMHDLKIANNYPIIGENKDDFELNEIQKKSFNKYKKSTLKTGKIIKIAIAVFIFIAYSIMFYYEDYLAFIDYIGFIAIAIVLPLWLIFTKFKGE